MFHKLRRWIDCIVVGRLVLEALESFNYVGLDTGYHGTVIANTLKSHAEASTVKAALKLLLGKDS